LFVHGLPHGDLSFANVVRGFSGSGDPRDRAFSFLPRLGVLYARLIGLAKIWVWAVPGLLLLACAGARKTWNDVRCRLLAVSSVATFVGYLFVAFDQGHGWGFRYFHAAWFVLPLFAAAALTASRATENAAGSLVDEQVHAFVIACALLTLIAGVAQRAVQIDGFVSSEVSQRPKYRGDEARVVIYTRWISPYGNGLIHNDPWLRDKVIEVFSHGPDADEAMMHARFPAYRRVYSDYWGSVWSGDPHGRPQAPAARHAELPRVAD
jgi:hypothetical protein